MRRILAVILVAALVALAVECRDAEAPAPTASPAAPARSPSPAPASTTASPEPSPTPTPDAVVASTFTIPTDELPVVRFVALDGSEALLPVETPSRSEYSIGLSGRYSLEDRGMLFYYADGRHTAGFWMKDTHLDLDIAFVDADHNVIEVDRMTAESLDVHRPSQPYLAAIEAPAGWYEREGIAAGARVEFLFDVTAVGGGG